MENQPCVQSPACYYEQKKMASLEEKQELVGQSINPDWQQQPVAPATTKEEDTDCYNYDISSSEKQQHHATSFTHKCPICNATLCSVRLLKEHMKEIHGWFAVERRFQCH